ncbi:MAG: DNA primase [Alistipes sp.]|jgi:DNA primase|nr:DNA primase [Alistipes sp.]MCI6439903.1 DNA primase [Alistipes sp.]CDD16441.1 dNA primase [Alistipes sp. CAG:435]
MIPQETVQKILDTARVEEVIGDFVTLRRRGADLWACCPFHGEKTPSFHVIPSKGQYYCFGCHKGGSAIGFVMDYEHLSYVEALRYLARKYNIEIVEKEETAEDIANRQRNESLLLVSEYAGKFFKEQLHTDEGRSVGLEYFHSRGLEDATIEKYGLGWAPSSRHALTDAAKAAGYKDEYLLETGLCAAYDSDNRLHDRFYDRVVFPIHSMSGRVIAFGARTLKSKEEGKPYAKYVNSKESDIYVKNKSLYGIWFAKNEMARKDKCYLVEGYLDVLSMHQLGITNVVASSGTALTEGQIGLIKRFTQNVTIMYDGDSAGIHAALRGIDMFLREGMNVKVVLIPDGDDPDSYSRKHSLAEVEEFLAAAEMDFVDFKSSLLLKDTARDPLKRAEVINDIADTIADIPDAVKRSVYVDFLSDKFEIRRDILDERIGATRSKRLIEQKKAADRDRERLRNQTSRSGASAGSATILPGNGYATGSGNGSIAGTFGVSGSSTDGLAYGGAPVAEPVEATRQSTGLDALIDNRIMATAERDLLNFILTYGTTKLEFQSDSAFYSGSDEDALTVFDFIGQALEGDNSQFANSVFRKVYEAYSKDYYEGYSQDEIVKRLMDGEDRDMAYVAAQLSTDERYDLSVKNLRQSMMSKGSWLTIYVPKAILVYQQSRLEDKENELKERLGEAQTASDDDRVLEIMQEMLKVQKALKMVKVRLGREK